MRKKDPSIHEVLASCGCTLQFGVRPRVNDEVFCTRHGQQRCVGAKGTRVLHCDTCDKPLPAFDNSQIYQVGKHHAFGKRGERAGNPHRVRVGTYVTLTDVDWKPLRGLEDR